MKNKDIKILFVDIDWTILDHSDGKHVFDKKSIQALKKAQKNGVLVYLATARPYHSVKCTGLLDMFEPDGMVCSNGAVAFHNDVLIHNDSFDKEDVKRIIEVCNQHNICLQLCSEKDRWLSLNPDKYVKSYFDWFFETKPEVRLYNNESVNGIIIFASDEFKWIFESYFSKFHYFKFFEYGYDIRHHEINKIDGLNRVLQYLNIEPSNALAIGDDGGDIGMFKVCGYSAAMGTSNDDVKSYAKYIAKSVSKHGVKDALKHFKVI